ncbi:uroporphyrinogen decarboxylase family protein [Desulfotomaculum copahuensis]|uniref:Uroporphyrinogen decarboxylase (URO-D) domain-containing protein n=1 Tax=Desulfotomaculum copahuensis TaxID=1838280 RepID=A0A1B7LCU7_9FIRM|nr:uroporphyrinogen decarboxylase family protein [Desulfotomaculum copahuensis]OAT80756.1 hypothetical protein A6M21_12990 [Desulfotomaculum copahuensis]
MSSPAELYQQRMERIQKAISLEEPDRVPVLSMIDTWAAGYAGYTIQEIAYDYEKLVKAFEKVIEDFDWDCVFPPLGTRPAPVYEALGNTQFAFAGQSTSAHSSLQHPEASPMLPEEYPEFIADPYAYTVHKILPRRYSELARPFPRNSLALAKGAMLFMQYLSFFGPVFEKWKQVYGMPVLAAGTTIAPLDVIEDYYRGFKGIILDIKRRPDDVKAACEALLPLMIRMAKISFGGPPAGFPPIFIPLHIATFLRPVDFKEFYWPTFRRLVETLAETGYTCIIFFEGDWEPFLEFLTELPRGKVIGLMESTDMKKAKAVLGNTMCLAGNLPTTLLNYGTEEEVIAYARELIDTVAPGGGFIFTTDKSLLSPNDAKAENIRAVNRFVREYGVYKK